MHGEWSVAFEAKPRMQLIEVAGCFASLNVTMSLSPAHLSLKIQVCSVTTFRPCKSAERST